MKLLLYVMTLCHARVDTCTSSTHSSSSLWHVHKPMQAIQQIGTYKIRKGVCHAESGVSCWFLRQPSRSFALILELLLPTYIHRQSKWEHLDSESSGDDAADLLQAINVYYFEQGCGKWSGANSACTLASTIFRQ